ncbi:hypothetical protein SASPL_120442 [Salvia splendens]|uniref:Uncharacterized protein n=1 Tax=Salvia splendens TaxID=180675 RepID=A0A8X8ZVM4_SALSN|nr:hypothetical protein SASPL_120442 [Salvia splendens]
MFVTVWSYERYKNVFHVLENLPQLAQKCAFGLENPDLWKWLTSQEEPPEAVKVNPIFIAVWQKVTSNLENHAAPGTRATPGQSWVRGWDDFKKGRDGPISGNQ